MEILEIVVQPIIAIEQMLRHHPDLSHDGHKIGIALPAGDDMPVKMIFDTCPGTLAQIHSQIDSSGSQCADDDFDGSTQALVEIAVLFQRKF